MPVHRPQSVAARASALLDVKRAEQARTLLRDHLAEAPGDDAALLQLARAELALNNPQGCLDAARAAGAIAPREEHPHRLAALALARLGALEDARAEAEQAVRLAPASWVTHLVRAQVDTTFGWVTSHTEHAAQEAVRLAPNAAEAHAMLGRVLLECGDHAAAQAPLRTALQIDPGNWVALNDLGRLQLRRGRFGAAAVGFAEAATRARGDDVARVNLVVAAYKAIGIIQIIEAIGFAVPLVWHGAAPTRMAPVPPLTLRVSWLVTTGVICAVVVLARRQAGAKALRIVRAVLITSRTLTIWLAILVGALAALGVAAFVPSGTNAVPFAIGFGLAAIAIVFRYVVMVSISRAQQARRWRMRGL